jgi:hypothetical protein
VTGEPSETPVAAIDDAKVVTHPDPVWRSQANFIKMADLADAGLPGSFEQLWLTDLGEDRYRLCCLPFLAYGYSLGDVIQTKEQGGRVVLGDVVEKSGRGLIRILIHSHGPDHAALHDELVAAGCLTEWRNDGFVSVDLERGAIPDTLMAAMTKLHEAGALQWEWAGARDVQGRVGSSNDIRER